jgi:hypothetical protein
MNKLIKLNKKVVVAMYLVIDVICVGAGMGVPIFCISLGFPLGWYISRRLSISGEYSRQMLFQILKISALASLFTFFMMIVIWGRMIPMLFNPMSDFQNFGHPFILYDPKISFIGWLILMILISPFLQLLTTIFTSFLTLIKIEKNENTSLKRHI